GVGPSDHTAFYLKDIPVLHFFTGQHDDYHKPEDDSHLINYEGLYDVAGYMLQLIEHLDTPDKLAFSKTKEPEQRKAARFKVTLGVMPDYVYSGKGMRIDAVLAGRTAAKGGLQDGDIVVKIGDLKVTDIYSYMEGLAKFKKGDKTQVVVKRGSELVTHEVEF
ncbi:MAG: PDZ domain-containing protein, partial [Bacteroidota bacterium]